MVRRVRKKINENILQEDLERYQIITRKNGASECQIIKASEVTVDERVRLKCFVPRCFRAGESANCPPHTPDLDLIRKALTRYEWAVIFKTDVEPLADYLVSRSQTPEQRRQVLQFHKKNGDLVNLIEGMAFRDGYYLAMGLGGGSCKDYICNGLTCQVLDSGRCRAPLRARPSMEAMGIDVFELANKVGWDIYPLTYAEDDPESIPCALSVGIVFIH